MTEQQLIEAFTNGMAHEEGWFDRRKIQTVAQRLNNPCCLPHWKDKLGNDYPEVNGFVEFPDADTGWRAARTQARINILKRKLSFREFFAGKPGVYRGFSPVDDTRAVLDMRKSDPVAYARSVLAFVKNRAGGLVEATIETPIFTLIAKKEGLLYAGKRPLAA